MAERGGLDGRLACEEGGDEGGDLSLKFGGWLPLNALIQLPAPCQAGQQPVVATAYRASNTEGGVLAAGNYHKLRALTLGQRVGAPGVERALLTPA